MKALHHWFSVWFALPLKILSAVPLPRHLFHILCWWVWFPFWKEFYNLSQSFCFLTLPSKVFTNTSWFDLMRRCGKCALLCQPIWLWKYWIELTPRPTPCKMEHETDSFWRAYFLNVVWKLLCTHLMMSSSRPYLPFIPYKNVMLKALLKSRYFLFAVSLIHYAMYPIRERIDWGDTICSWQIKSIESEGASIGHQV